MRLPKTMIPCLLLILNILAVDLQADSTGSDIYRQYCATCHGLDARGGNTSGLFDDRWEFSGLPQQIRANIVGGIDNLGMPAFGSTLTAAQVDALMDYFETKPARKAAPPPTRRHQEVQTLDYRLRVAHWIPAEDGLRTPWAIDFIDTDAGRGGLLDVAVDPAYAENGWIYLGYSHEAGPGARSPAMTRVVRGRIQHHTWSEEKVIIEAPRDTYINSRYHYGTRIVFDAQGFLYFSIGDRGLKEQAQDISRPTARFTAFTAMGALQPITLLSAVKISCPRFSAGTPQFPGTGRAPAERADEP